MVKKETMFNMGSLNLDLLKTGDEQETIAFISLFIVSRGDCL